MIINKRTKTVELMPLLANPDTFDTLIDAVDEVELPKRLLSMTCGEFIEAVEPDYAMGYLRQKRALRALGMIKSYKRQMDEITKVLRLNKVRESEEMKRAKYGVVFPSFGEDILLTVAEYLGLDRIEKAADVPLSEFLMIHRRKSSETKVSENYRKIMEQKSKANNGKRR